jgi:hypothetical protein
MNIGEQSWPDPAGVAWRVRQMQCKLHHWAVADSGRRFDDVFNLVHHPDFLTVAWDRVRGPPVTTTPQARPPSPRNPSCALPSPERWNLATLPASAANVRRRLHQRRSISPLTAAPLFLDPVIGVLRPGSRRPNDAPMFRQGR